MGNMIVGLINKIIVAVGSVLIFFINLLPNSPFTWDFSELDNTFLKVFLWIVPVPTLITIFNTFLGAVIIYYGYRIILRWLKVAGD